MPQSTDAIAPTTGRKRKAVEDQSWEKRGNTQSQSSYSHTPGMTPQVSENQAIEAVKIEHDEDCQTISIPECSIEEVEEINTAENGESIDNMPLALENGGVSGPKTEENTEFFVGSVSGFETH